MELNKFFWACRMAFYAVCFEGIKMPGYLGKPILMRGLKRIKLGRKVRIFPGARFEVHGNGEIDIRDNVSIGQGFHVASQGNLVINSGTVISGNVLITNIDHEYKDVTKPILSQPHIVKETTIGENCFIGFGSVIQAGTVLGNHCVVGANSVVRGHFPDYTVLAGVPAKSIKKYDLSKKEWVRCV